MSKRLWVYEVIPEQKKKYEVMTVVAEDKKTAEGKLFGEVETKNFKFRLYGDFDVSEIYTVERLGPVTTSAALRYAADEYSKFLTEIEKENLKSASDKIFNLVLQNGGS